MRTLLAAGVLGGLLFGCSGGQTGQPSGSHECPEEAEPAAVTMARFEGSYSSPVSLTETPEGQCTSEEHTWLRLELSSDFGERELLERECGADWLPVTLELSTDDGALQSTESGWLTPFEHGPGGIHIDAPSWLGSPVALELNPDERSIASDVPIDGFWPFEDCCLTDPAHSFSELTLPESLGLIELVPSAPEAVGADTLALELRIEAPPPVDACFEAGVNQHPFNFELVDSTGTIVAGGNGTAEAIACRRGDDCLIVDLYARGAVVNPTTLGAGQPVNGQAGRVFLDALFDSCKTLPLVELGIAVGVELENQAVELLLTPSANSLGATAPEQSGTRDRCLCTAAPGAGGQPPEVCR